MVSEWLGWDKNETLHNSKVHAALATKYQLLHTSRLDLLQRAIIHKEMGAGGEERFPQGYHEELGLAMG